MEEEKEVVKDWNSPERKKLIDYMLMIYEKIHLKESENRLPPEADHQLYPSFEEWVRMLKEKQKKDALVPLK